MRLPVASLVIPIILPAFAGAARAQVPDDAFVIWESNREDGRAEVYRARPSGSEVTRLTRSGAHRPMWSPDGRWISYLDDAGAVLVMRPDGTEVKTLSAAGGAAFWLHDNGGLVLGEGAQYLLADPDTGDKVPLWKQSDFPAFAGTTFQPNSMTHDNRYLLLGSHLYMNGYTGTNGSFTAGFSAVMVDLLARDKVYFLGNGCWPFTPPAGDLIFHVCGDSGCPAYPDIMRLHLADLGTRSSYQAEISHPDPDWGHEYNPRISTDGKWMVYMTSTGCHDGYGCDYEIFLHQVGAGATERRRVTVSPSFDGYPEMFVGPLWKKDPAPRLLLTPGRVTVHASAGTMPPVQVVKVKNGGGGELGQVQVAIEPPVSWLAVETAAGALTFRVSPGAGLARGRNQANVTVSAAGLPGAPITLPFVVMGDGTLPAMDGGTAGGDGGTADGAVASDAPASPPAGSGKARGDGCSCDVGGAGGERPWLALLASGWLLFGLIRNRRVRSPR